MGAEDYKPDNGPFFAEARTKGWSILAPEESGIFYIVDSGLQVERRVVVSLVNRLNALVRYWVERETRDG